MNEARTGLPDAATPADYPARLKLLRWVGRQTWIPKGQDWLLRRIWHPDGGRQFAFEVDFFGARYQGNLAHYVDWSVFAYGSHALAELTLLDALAAEIRQRRGRVCYYDVGANVGHHSLYMAPRVDAVIAFEPYGPLREEILTKMKRNAFDHVRVIPFAIGETDETLNYYPGETANSGTGTFRPEAEETRRAAIPLEIRNGDRLCEEQGLPPIDLMKVDVEGFEPRVFRGLAARIARDRPPILTELSGKSMAGYASEAEFRRSFWDGAVFAEVCGREGCPFELRPFVYGHSGEVLIVPPEMTGFVASRMKS
jgi:FkbM family methyltransferase